MSILRRKDEAVRFSKKMFGGDGEVKMTQILNGADEMYGKGRLFNHVTLEPGCGLGWHVHTGDGETYFVLRGHAEYNDNGVLTQLHPGDVAFVGSGEGHAIKNTGDEPVELVALILYEQ